MTSVTVTGAAPSTPASTTGLVVNQNNPNVYVTGTHKATPPAPSVEMKANIAAALFGSRGEFKVESVEGDKDFVMGAFKNGIWEKKRTFVGEFVYKKVDCAIPYLNQNCEMSFNMLLPKLPGNIYHATVAFFKKVAESRRDEVMVQIFWNKTEEKYEIFVPTQRVAGASINFDRNAGPMIDPNKIWVMDCHSHVYMQAFFSGTDSSDEVSTRLFGVIGQLNLAQPASKWRAGVNGQFIEQSIDQIFDFSDETEYVISDLELMKVSSFVRPAVVTPQYGQGGYGGSSYLSGRPSQYAYKGGVTPPPPSSYNANGYDHYAGMSEEEIYNELYGYGSSSLGKAQAATSVSPSGIVVISSETGTIDSDPEADEMLLQAQEMLKMNPDVMEIFDSYAMMREHLKAWTEDTINASLVSQIGTNDLVMAFFELLESSEALDVNTMRRMVTELSNRSTTTQWNMIVDHINSL